VENVVEDEEDDDWFNSRKSVSSSCVKIDIGDDDDDDVMDKASLDESLCINGELKKNEFEVSLSAYKSAHKSATELKKLLKLLNEDSIYPCALVF